MGGAAAGPVGLPRRRVAPGGQRCWGWDDPWRRASRAGCCRWRRSQPSAAVVAAAVAVARTRPPRRTASRETSSTWTPGVFEPPSDFAALCASPRSGTDPYTEQPYPDRQGTTTDENNWLRSWTHELYLWYDEVQDENPALYTTPDYFQLMKTMETTSSGAPKDRFHFTYPTSVWESLSRVGRGGRLRS